MKAVFKWFNGNDFLVKRKFTIGKEYIIQDAGFGFHITEDDNGKSLIFQNGVDYTFELVEDGKFIKNGDAIKGLIASLKFYINGFPVSPEVFEDTRSIIRGLDMDGVKCDTIKFEVKFE